MAGRSGEGMPLSRNALRRVLHSLVLSACAPAANAGQSSAPRIDEASLFHEEAAQLGFDSLDMVQISAAVNEMFHLYEVGMETLLPDAHSFAGWLDIIEQAWARGVAHVTVTTSGSSGHPKPCTHTFAALQVEVDFLADTFGDRRRVVAFTPAHHMYGLLFSAMLPDRLGIPADSLVNTSVGGAVEVVPGDLLATFPEGWKWLLSSRKAFPEDVVGVVSTAPCPKHLLQTLMDANLSKLVEVYGSSETAGVGIRAWPEDHYTLMPHWTLCMPLDAKATRLEHCGGFTVEVMDHLAFVDNIHFRVQGRKDHAVQVGGVNVSPGLVAERLKSRAGVSDASVRLMRPDEGQRLKCFVIPAKGYSAEQLHAQLERWIATWPVAAERPKDIRFGEALPCGSMGKLQDW